ncbi:GMC family oxidoreductase [Natronococcus pandeyae]|uniref:GMC family oxidoreductase n=1 Tax=Natronococcus pandeyae TaxID=2055836 RepID=A0A8J8PZ10_9EURY|nr:GMC family oxidoreductase [Natronococcus pandeyae]TYL36406.1 GMC family oxidoreductase [Natronococcus pandeyae]
MQAKTRRTTRAKSIDRAPSDRVDVCVIGSGPAGALIAYTLAERGHDVVVLDAGKRFDPANRERRMEMALRPGHDFVDVWEMGGRRDRYTVSGDRFYQLNRTRVKGIGGSTLHWVGMTPRLHEKDFEMRSRYGLAADWPIDYADLRPYYAAAERELGVAGAEDNPFAPPREEPYPLPAFPPSHSDSIFADACEEIGIQMHSAPQARNSEAYDGRSQCAGYGTCMPVCPAGAKYSADVHVRKAEAAGARVVDRAAVQRLRHDESGEYVESAVYVTPAGETHAQRADAFAVCCGGVETPRLLLLSESDAHPDGLANSSGAVGRYFMEHPSVSTTAELDQDTRQHHIGFPTSESHQFYDHEEPRPGSFTLEFQNTAGSDVHGYDGGGGMGGILAPLYGAEWGDDLLETMRDRYGNTVAVSATAEQLPDAESRVTLDRSTSDEFGNPVPNIEWRVGSHAVETLEHALSIHRNIVDRIDGTITGQTDPRTPGTVAHHLGTTRMGDDPDESVVNARLRTHDVRNLYLASGSVFVTGGAMPPTLTIAALSLKAADHIDSAL